jgi:uroporphyrinogen decarboxylase
MTWRERWDAMLAGQRVDRVAMHHFIPGFCARNLGYPVAIMYQDPQKSFEAQLLTMEQYGFDGGPDYGYASYGGWEFGGKIKFPQGEFEQAPSHANFPVQTEEDVWKMELPDIKNAGSVPYAFQFSQLQEKYSTPISVVFGGNFTIAGNICPVSTLCRWTIKKPELAHHILRLATDYSISLVKYWADTFGAERVIPNIWEPLSSNDLISPRQFEKFVFPYLKETSEKMVKMGIKHILYHICGEQNMNLPYWAQIPMGDPGLVSVGNQVDITDAIKYFGNNNIIIGNIEPSLIQTGNFTQVYDACQKAIIKGKKAPSGYMLMSGCELPPMTPPYHVYVMRKAINDIGWYDTD